MPAWMRNTLFGSVLVAGFCTLTLTMHFSGLLPAPPVPVARRQAPEVRPS